MRRGLAAVLAAGLLASAAACSGGGEPAGPTTTVAAPTTTTAAAAAVAGPAPTTIPAGQPGAVVASEPIEVGGHGGFRVTYTSTGVTGGPVEVTGLVLVPDGDPPEFGWPIVAWAHGTTGGADACAPSRVPVVPGLAEVLGDLVADGFVVVATDYEGIGGPGPHPYLDGPSAARSIADSVRAARVLVPGAGRPWVVAGHSQGGHAALWAAELAPTYMPENVLMGALAVAPVVDLPALVDPGAGGTAFLLLAAAGFTAAAPDVDPATVLSPVGLAALDVVERACLSELVRLYGGPSVGDPLLPGAGAPGTPFGDHLAANRPGQVAPGPPLLVVHGEDDAVVPAASSAALVDRLCGLGAFVELRTYVGAGHGTVLRAAATDARRWVEARFAGPPPAGERTCPS